MRSTSDKQVGGDHYKLPIQPIEFITKNGIGFIEGNVIKYVCRHRSKNGRQDIEKAIHYLELLLEHEYPVLSETLADVIDNSKPPALKFE